ncbi:MAG: phenylalanine--tRNA ligase subunit beta [Victivallales bacterium]|jgi:phenylalanyl-tRNA synthetase beta chain|nr:phenylalanine--tRNA ligase subunit beta [Victivallales bacterium]MBT7302428.1 phenylalanine--tRNA ligase subunit beta [Victivallales bacterium]
MKTSIKWLENYIDIDWEPAEMAERLTMAGLEVEGIESTCDVPETVVVAEILDRQPHPDADTLSVCSVNVGEEAPLQIVCGAPNCDAGKKVPCARIGTVLGEKFKIKKSKIRGVVSFGMLCAADELGLGGAHSGLLELPADAPVGEPVIGSLASADTVIDWEVTPNRPDWLCHIGIAREIAAVTGTLAAFRLPDVSFCEASDAKVADMASVEVLDAELCPRYTVRVIRNITIAPSPEWLQEALRAVGLRPINNVVDITNYVMMECGQPLHAFDYEFLAGRRIVVRRAAAGEKITTLDEVERELTCDNLLICDGEKGVALAGVMGGLASEIRDTTTTVLLESAVFHASNIRATSRDLGVSSDSSHRFERGVGLDMCEFASRRAAALIAELGGGEVVAGVIDAYPKPYTPHTVTARFAKINSLIGVDIPRETVRQQMLNLGLTVSEMTEETINVSIPSFRHDLEREADIVEEVARLFGLENIPAAMPVALSGGPREADGFYPLEESRAQLRGLGLQETMTYSFINPEAATKCTGVTDEQLIKPVNPLSIELGTLRPSLIPAMIASTAHNIAHNIDDLAIFEQGRVLVNAPGLPEERNQIGIVMTGRVQPERYGDEKAVAVDLYDLKGVLEGWFEARRLTAVCAAAEHPSLVPGLTAAFEIDGQQVAVFGQVCEELTQDMRLKHPVFMAVIELDRVLACAERPRIYEPLPQFPATTRDIAILADAGLENQAVVDAVFSLRLPLIERVELFDIYEDEKALGAGKKSLAYSVVYRDARATLTDKKVNKLHEKVRQHLVKTLGVELR